MDITAQNPRRLARSADTRRSRRRIAIYFERHIAALISSLGVLWRTPVAALATILALGVALVFPGVLGIAMINATALAGQWTEGGQVTVYLRRDVAPAEIERLTQLLQQQTGVRAVRHITPDAGLAELREVAGLGKVTTELGENPLPHVLVAEAAPQATPEQVAAVRDRAAADSVVEQVQSDIEWVTQLHTGAQFIVRVFWVVAVLLSITVMLTVANTVRVMVTGRQAEIEVQKLVGANHAFVRRPLLYSGLWIGFFGGVAAVALLLVTFAVLEMPLTRLRLWFGEVAWWEPGVSAFLGVVILSMFLGWAGAWLCAWHYLRRSINQ